MAKTDYVLEIDSVRGETKRGGKNQLIEIREFEFSTLVPQDGATGEATGRRRYSNVTFRKVVDSSSPILQQMLATHSKIRKATLTLSKTGTNKESFKYYKLIVSEGYISSYRILGKHIEDEFGAIPRDEFAINFKKIVVDYMVQANSGASDGNLSFIDDITANQAR